MNGLDADDLPVTLASNVVKDRKMENSDFSWKK